MRPCNRHILETLRIAEEMIRLADRGENDREDSGCGILFGVLRDAGCKIRRLAEAERERHIRKGWWTGEPGETP
ncbi:MAG: hypothetical protein WHT06_01015 [Desulfobacterales bacterium]